MEGDEEGCEDNHSVLVERVTQLLVIEQAVQVRDASVPRADHRQAAHRQQDVLVLGESNRSHDVSTITVARG